MENTSNFSSTTSASEEESLELTISSLPKARKLDGNHLYLYQDFWYPLIHIKPVISFQNHFQAQDSDIILASFPKSGTTWLKALTYSVVNRTRFSNLDDSPLNFSSPHDLVPFLEYDLYYLKNEFPDLESIPEPTMFSTHVPYASLPSSITDSKCRIVYVGRNPLDQLISYWKFSQKRPGYQRVDPASVEEAFENHCRGIHSFGPFWHHVLGYWKASQEHPDKVLFLKYEDLKEENIVYLKRLADFLGFPFSAEEEETGVVEKISNLCSFENLKNLEVNKNVRHPRRLPNSSYFRKGEIGDWKNYLKTSMAEQFEKLIEEKLEGSGLSFKVSPKRVA